MKCFWICGMDWELGGKRAIVTGGANGIGFAVARLLVAEGALVSIFDLESERPQESARAIGAKGFAADVTNRASLEEAFEAAGAPDIVIANAGVAKEADFCEHRASDWERILSVNLTGAFHTVQAAARRMKPRQTGAIVITASTNSYDGEARLAAYNASKAGLLGLVHTAANELGPYQIRVNAVCPGLIRTRLTERHFSTPEVLREYFRHIPLGRGGEPDEVARASVFLASGLASYITGATLFVDGGQMAAKFGTWNEADSHFSEGKWRLGGVLPSG